MAELIFKWGAMNCGKSLQLLTTRNSFLEQDKRVMIYTSSVDTRSGDNKVESRLGLSCPAKYAHQGMFIEVLRETNKEKVHCVLVDEAQFLTRKEVEVLTDIVDELAIDVICYGLRTDFRNELFEGSKALFALADELEELKTVCKYSDQKATVNVRIDRDGNVIRKGEQVQVGDLGDYCVVSRKVYKKMYNIHQYERDYLNAD